MNNVLALRKHFPTLDVLVNGKPLIYLDNAATTLKPKAVIDALTGYYTEYTSNVHRGLHTLSEKATSAFEASRANVRRFINAEDEREIIFTSGTTDSINLVAGSFGQKFVHPGDEILISAMEHHSNIVPWQMLCQARGGVLKVIPINDRGELVLETLDTLLTSRTRLLAVTHISNSLGTVNPVETIIQQAHARDIPVFIDAAQSAGHTRIDVQKLDCDFLAFSGHKIFGPTGIGVLYGKKKWLEVMEPVKGGGDMIETVTLEKSTYAGIPAKFEAGTPHIAGVIGLGAAIDFLTSIDWVEAQQRKTELLALATEELQRVPGLRIIGTARQKAAVISFVIKGVHAHDLGTLLDQEGVAVRTGHHCAMPVMRHFGVTATTRASLSIYTTSDDITRFISALNKVCSLFS